jgi:hypothetical protein
MINPNKTHTLSMAAAGLLALALLSLLALPASAEALKSETRNPGNFSKISTSGAFELEITAGQSSSSVVVSADDDLLSDIKTVVKGDELHISMERNHYYTSHRTVIRIAVPKLSAISASGANKITASNLAGDRFDMEGSGSTKAVLSGSVGKLSISVSGAGRVDAGALAAKTAEIETSGAGNVDVNASDKLEVSISGAGKVTYAGHPVISKSISGAGKIAAKD